MRLCIRVYRRWDYDLFVLAMNGYAVNDLIRDSLTAYANGVPFHVFTDRVLNAVKPGEKSRFEYNIAIPNQDKKTVELLKNLAPRMKNSFCKAVVRNAMLKQNLSVYFTRKDLFEMEKKNLMEYTTVHVYGLRSLAVYREKNRSRTFLTDVLRSVGVNGAEGLTASMPEGDFTPSTYNVRTPEASPAPKQMAAPAVVPDNARAAAPAVSAPVPAAPPVQPAPAPVVPSVPPVVPDTYGPSDSSVGAPADDNSDILKMFDNI